MYPVCSQGDLSISERVILAKKAAIFANQLSAQDPLEQYNEELGSLV